MLYLPISRGIKLHWKQLSSNSTSKWNHQTPLYHRGWSSSWIKLNLILLQRMWIYKWMIHRINASCKTQKVKVEQLSKNSTIASIYIVSCRLVWQFNREWRIARFMVYKQTESRCNIDHQYWFCVCACVCVRICAHKNY